MMTHLPIPPRPGHLWRLALLLFMSSPDVQRGLGKLGFESPALKK